MSPSLRLASVLTAFGTGSAWMLSRQFPTDAGLAIAFGATLAILNGLGAILFASLGAGRASTRGFLGAVLGGMLLRLVGTLGGLVIGLKAFALPAPPLAAALLGYTALFVAAEVALWSGQTFSPRVRTS